nr:integrase core domain-containing protein [Nonomuraea spiralis]
MPHRNAPLTELGRLRLARCVVEDGWPLRRAAERFQVAVTTARRWADRSHLWPDTLAKAGITHKRTRPYRPQTNGKAERFNRTLLDERAYAQPYASETARRAALPAWLHTYNHHRGHTALNGLPPASRVPNLRRVRHR